MKSVLCSVVAFFSFPALGFDGVKPDCYGRMLNIQNTKGVRIETDILELDDANVLPLVLEAIGTSCKHSLDRSSVDCLRIPEENPTADVCVLDTVHGYFLVNLSYEGYANVEFFRWDFW